MRSPADGPTVLAVMFAMSLGLTGGRAWAQDAKPQIKARPRPAAKPADPKAQALLSDVAKAYKALGSYSDDGKFVVAMTLAGKPQNQTVPLKLTFVRPNKLDLDAGPVRLTSDGKTLDHRGDSPQAVHHGTLARQHQSRHVSRGTDGRDSLWRTRRSRPCSCS